MLGDFVVLNPDGQHGREERRELHHRLVRKELLVRLRPDRVAAAQLVEGKQVGLHR